MFSNVPAFPPGVEQTAAESAAVNMRSHNTSNTIQLLQKLMNVMATCVLVLEPSASKYPEVN